MSLLNIFKETSNATFSVLFDSWGPFDAHTSLWITKHAKQLIGSETRRPPACKV